MTDKQKTTPLPVIVRTTMILLFDAMITKTKRACIHHWTRALSKQMCFDFCCRCFFFLVKTTQFRSIVAKNEHMIFLLSKSGRSHASCDFSFYFLFRTAAAFGDAHVVRINELKIETTDNKSIQLFFFLSSTVVCVMNVWFCDSHRHWKRLTG